MEIIRSEALGSNDSEIADYEVYLGAAVVLKDLKNTRSLHFRILDEDSCRFSLQLDGRPTIVCQLEKIGGEVCIRVLEKRHGGEL